MAFSTANFIEKVGLRPTGSNENNSSTGFAARTVAFKFDKNVPSENGGWKKETVNLEVPLLSVVKIPSLAISKVNITFDMEVKTSEQSKEESTDSKEYGGGMSAGFWIFKASASIKGSVSTHKENT